MGCRLFLTILISVVTCQIAYSQNELAFPGAEGFGKYTSGGRGGKIFIVNNLNDSGEGSLRAAVEAKGARTVVFAMSGIIELESPLVIKNDSITIAGQTAPGDGICITNYITRVQANSVIIRYLRFRLGSKKEASDAFTAIRQSDLIIDHCSMSWGSDETATFYDNERTTVQWCIVSESLHGNLPNLSHKASGYGGIWGGKNASFLYNLIAHHNTRTPRLNGKRYSGGPDQELVEFRNNVIYNWRANPIYGGESGSYNIVNNYFKPGPATPANRRTRMINPYPPYGKFYIDGNVITTSPIVSRDNWVGKGTWTEGVALEEKKDRIRSVTPLVKALDEPVSAQEAYLEVLKYAGASLNRDEVDKRIVRETKFGTATFGREKNGIISSEEDIVTTMKLSTSSVTLDSDQDGMPDQWEVRNGLNPADSSDRNKIEDGTHYTYLEVYLNSLVPPVKQGGFFDFLNLF